jgi:hypothetical protein
MMMARQWRQRWRGGGSGGGAEAVERQRQQRWRSAPTAELPPPTPQQSCRSRHHRPRSVALLPWKSCHPRAACAKLQQPPAATAAARPPAEVTTAATTAATTRTTTMTAAAAAAKAMVMATAAASGRHGESSSVLAAGARMETSDKFSGEPVDCCLCLCPPPSRCFRQVAAVASPPSRCRRPCRRHSRCRRCHRRRRCRRRLMDAMIKKYARVGRWREDGRQQNKWRRLWLRLQYAQNCRYNDVGRCGPSNDRGTPGK